MAIFGPRCQNFPKSSSLPGPLGGRRGVSRLREKLPPGSQTGDFVGLVAYKATTIDAMTAEQVSGNALSSMAIAAGTEIYIRFTSITCASGGGLFLYKA